MSTPIRPTLVFSDDVIRLARTWVEEQRDDGDMDQALADAVLHELADGKPISELRAETVEAVGQGVWLEHVQKKLETLRKSPRAKEVSDETLQQLAGLCTGIEEHGGPLRIQAINYVAGEQYMLPPVILGMEPGLAAALRSLREALQMARQVRVPEPRDNFDRTVEKRFRALAKDIVHAALPTVLAKKDKQMFAELAYEILEDEKISDVARHELVSHAMQSSKIDMGASPDALRKRKERAKAAK
ncbi:MAG: hypothetical protein H6721_24115 [Sandaracinus sp.]|nr:hypothetical protein [Sandaracinus sp.]MCB9635219.1 hypothetical protein [Sandaracinus sp.]